MASKYECIDLNSASDTDSEPGEPEPSTSTAAFTNSGGGGLPTSPEPSTSRAYFQMLTGENYGYDSDQSEEDELDEEEDEQVMPPPSKVLKLENGESRSSHTDVDDEDDSHLCNICCEPFTNAGDHRICCLKCGHVFGHKCILEWFQKGRSQCPQCNSKALKSQIRILYVKNLVAMDNTELVDTKKQLEAARIGMANYQLEGVKKVIEVERLQQQISDLERRLKQSQTSTASPVKVYVPVMNVSPRIPGRNILCLKHKRSFEITNGGGRVGAFNERNSQLVVSQNLKSALYPNGCFGVKMFNMLDFRCTKSFPIHQKPIRDAAFSLDQNDVLLTVSLDKKAVLFNVSGNVAVQSFQTESPLWSCAWDEVHPYIFYAGTSDSNILIFDIRAPRDQLSTLIVPKQDPSAICRIRYVQPTYRSSAFTENGLLIQKLNSVLFCGLRGPTFHQLPLEGPFVSADYDPVSRLVLVSTRPVLSGARAKPMASHMICELTQCYSEALQSNIVSSNLVHSYQGGDQELTKICRTSIFSPEEGYTYAFANGQRNAVKLWDVSLPVGGEQIVQPISDTVVDYVHGTVNDYKFTAMISDKQVDLFESKLE